MRRTWVGVAALLILLPAWPSRPADGGGAPVWHVGDRWVYRVRDCYGLNCTVYNDTVEVLGMETLNVNGTPIETYRVRLSSEREEIQPFWNGVMTWYRTSDLAEVRFVTGDGNLTATYVPPLAMLPFPLTVGDSRHVCSNLTSEYGTVRVEWFVDVVNATEVVVPAGASLAYEVVLNEQDHYFFSPTFKNFVRTVQAVGVSSLLIEAHLYSPPADRLGTAVFVLGLLGVAIAVFLVLPTVLLRWRRRREGTSPPRAPPTP